MSQPVQIRDGGYGTATLVKVTSLGQLVVAPLAYDEVSTSDIPLAFTGVTFFKPKAGKQFVITGIYLRATSSVSPTTDATLEVFESTSLNGNSVIKGLFLTSAVKNDHLEIGGLNILVREGFWVNASTSDPTVRVTMTGYYIPKIN